MKPFTTALLLILSACLLLSACSTPEPDPAAPAVTPSTQAATAPPSTPSPTHTPPPTASPTSEATPTRVRPSITPTQAAGSLPPLPVGEPSASWKDVPVMPGALAGEGDDKGYTFTTYAAPDEVQAYYEQALSDLGWQALTTGVGQYDSRIIIFLQNTATLSIAIFVHPEENLTVVLLVK